MYGGVTVPADFFRRCAGASRCLAHSQLSGKIPGTSVCRTAAAAVYPQELVAALVHILLGVATVESSPPPFQEGFLYWTCDRCKHGTHRKLPDGTSAPTTPHTKQKGCRFDTGRAPPGGVPQPVAAPPVLPPVPAPPPGLGPGSSGDGLPVIPPAPLAPDADDPDSDAVAPPVPSGPPVAVAAALSPEAGPPRADADETGVIDPPSYVEPAFDLRRLREKLENPAVSEKQKRIMLMGLHVRFWHASDAELERLLFRGGHCK